MPRPNDDDLLSAAEAAELLGIAPSSWRSRVHRYGIEADAYLDRRTPRWYRRTVLETEKMRDPRGRRPESSHG